MTKLIVARLVSSFAKVAFIHVGIEAICLLLQQLLPEMPPVGCLTIALIFNVLTIETAILIWIRRPSN